MIVRCAWLVQTAYQVVSKRSNKHAIGETLACNTAGVLSAHGLSAGLRVEWKRTRDRHCVTGVLSVSSCQVAPVSRRTGCCVARARGHKERASNLWTEARKASRFTRLLSSSCFSPAHTLDVDILSLHQTFILAYSINSYKDTQQRGTHTTSVLLTAKLRSSPALRILARVAAMAQ